MTLALPRIWRVVRLHYVNWPTSILLPWGILILIFLVNLTIWYLIAYATGDSSGMEGTQYTGSIFYLLVYQAVFAIQLMNATFAYGMGMSSTRRDYYLGTALTFGIHAAMFAVGVVLLSYLEQWTGGWGVGGHMFQTIYFGTGPLWQRLFTFFFAVLGVLFVGAIFGAVFVRWRALGLYALGAAWVVALLAAIAGFTFTDSWPAVGRWFLANGTLGVVSWSIVLTAACAVIGFLALRRAVPRSS